MGDDRLVAPLVTPAWVEVAPTVFQDFARVHRARYNDRHTYQPISVGPIDSVGMGGGAAYRLKSLEALPIEKEPRIAALVAEPALQIFDGDHRRGCKA
jgi:hypothetical protein